MNKNQSEGVAKKIEGNVQELGGKIREKVDSAVGDHTGAAHGVRDQAAGKAKQVAGEVQKTAGNIQENVKKAFSSDE